MAQSAIREFDAKSMFADFCKRKYTGVLVKNSDNMNTFLENAAENESYVIKPDQLFGKRGKYGLLGVNMDKAKIRDWWKEHHDKEVAVEKQRGILHTFLIEPFVSHKEEYYVAIRTERDYDEMFFSTSGGIDVEENWETVASVQIPLGESSGGTEITSQDTSKGVNLRNIFAPRFSISDPLILDFLVTLYDFFLSYGFTYLEVNPFTQDRDGEIVALDMVARLDSCEAYKQKSHWKDLEFVNPFGSEKTPAEQYIEELDASTGASLKFRVLNPAGSIWLLTSGGGASVIIADTIADMGYAHEIGNYGECSGNPDRENTAAYTRTLLDTMLANGRSPQYLIIAGAIANFTHIDKTFSGIIDALTERAKELIEHNVKILVRRGGINDIKGLQLIKEACERLELPCEIADGNSYMTDILEHIKY